MRDLVMFLIRELADTEDVEIVETERAGGFYDMEIYVKKSEVGKVIGKQGKIAKAHRTVVRAAAAKQSKKYDIVIREKEEKADENPL
jgi:predicted RNA-binding protein YlqC (UPF0109 family)